MKKLHYKFVLNILLTSTLPLVILALITIVFLHRLAVNDACGRTRDALYLAMRIYEGVADNLRYVVHNQNQRACALIETNRVYVLRKELKSLAAEHNFDFFIVTDETGKVITSLSNPFLAGADFSGDYFLQKALQQKRAIVSTEIESEQELRRLGIAKKAMIPSGKEIIANGLVINATTPIINRDDIVIGTMSAGYLLNNNSFIIDKITQATKQPVSIFLGEKRISTNLPYPVGRFALGSSINGEIVERVLRNSKKHIGRQRIVNQWYMAGYNPLYNYERDAIGMLGIAIPEYRIFAFRNNQVLFFSIVVAISVVLAFVAGIFNANNIVSHIGQLHRGIEAFGKGDHNFRVKINSGDEIEEIGNFFNQTMSQLEKARRDVMDLRREVRKSSEKLESAQKLLLDYEKMAAMGKMATAVNHELKNVFAQIQISIARSRSKEIKDSSKLNGYLKDIEDGLNYANGVLSNLLRLSNPKRLILSEVNINILLEDLLSSNSFQTLLETSNIIVVKNLYPDITEIKADGIQIREVFSNLITNSIQAMPEGGRLTIASKMEKDSIRIEVSDTGKGISKEALESIFTPFFTTKSKGMGLGLCISKDIIDAHKGTIEIKTDSAAFTTFIVKLPIININQQLWQT